MVAVRRTHSGIPTGFCPKAQGCRSAATLGQDSPSLPNRNAVAAILLLAHAVGHNPVGVIAASEPSPKVGVVRQPWAGSRNPFGIARGHILCRCSFPIVTVRRTKNIFIFSAKLPTVG